MLKHKSLKALIMNFSDKEHGTKDFYERLWADPDKIGRSDQGLFLGWHYGFYEKGIKDIREAMINMNNYIDRLLEINDETVMNILDAGSGVGSTSIHLAEKHPNCLFNGIVLTDNELKIAEYIKKEKSIENVHFKQGSYMNSGFSDNYFDRIFALESATYAPNKKEFITEMYRLLKPKGKLIIIDTFTKKYVLNSLAVNIDNYLHQRKCTQRDLENYYVGIDNFITYLKSENFKEIDVSNLVDSGNVRVSHIYGFLIYRLLPYLSLNLGKIREKRSSLKYKFMYPFAFFALFVYRTLLTFGLKPGYYSIEAIKK